MARKMPGLLKRAIMNNDHLEALLSGVGDMSLKRRVKIVLEWLALKDSDVLLDCGCGDGLYYHFLSSFSSCQYYGLDLNFENIKKNKANQDFVHAIFHYGNILNLPYKANMFDKIISSETLEHVDDDLRALRELYRVLKKRGTMLLTVPNHNYPFLWDPINSFLETVANGRHFKTGFLAGLWNQHLRLYHPDEILKVVKNAGFIIEDVQLVTHYCLPFNHYLINAVAIILSKNILTGDIARSLCRTTSRKSERLFLIEAAFKFANWVDKLNDRLGTDGKSSVCIAIKATKP